MKTSQPMQIQPMSADNSASERKNRPGSVADVIRGSDYRIGSDDLLEISIYGAPDLGGTFRVSHTGSISMPLTGDVQAAGLTARELESQIENLLARGYMNHPHASVLVKEIESHPVAVLGAVARPGIYQLRGPAPLASMLSRAQGLTDDAGTTAIVMRSTQDERRNRTSAGPQEDSPGGSITVDLQELLSSNTPKNDVTVYPGDTIKVPRAGVVYVIGEVHKPGGFLLRTNEGISVLQALALAEGLKSTAAAKAARLIRTDRVSGARHEISINLKKILSGRASDLPLQAKDIVFVPNSAGKTAVFRGTEAAISIAAGVIVYRR